MKNDENDTNKTDLDKIAKLFEKAKAAQQRMLKMQADFLAKKQESKKSEILNERTEGKRVSLIKTKTWSAQRRAAQAEKCRQNEPQNKTWTRSTGAHPPRGQSFPRCLEPLVPFGCLCPPSCPFWRGLKWGGEDAKQLLTKD